MTGVTRQNLICFSRSTDTGASALSSRQWAQLAEANSLHSSDRAAAGAPGLSGMSYSTLHLWSLWTGDKAARRDACLGQDTGGGAKLPGLRDFWCSFVFLNTQ